MGRMGASGARGRSGDRVSSGASGRNLLSPLLDCHPEKPIGTSDLRDRPSLCSGCRRPRTTRHEVRRTLLLPRARLNAFPAVALSQLLGGPGPPPTSTGVWGGETANPSVLLWVQPASPLGPPSPHPARFRGDRLRGPCEASPGLTA